MLFLIKVLIKVNNSFSQGKVILLAWMHVPQMPLMLQIDARYKFYSDPASICLVILIFERGVSEDYNTTVLVQKS